VPEGSKEEIADAVWDAVTSVWTHRTDAPPAPVE
jgi:hypothetical protein